MENLNSIPGFMELFNRAHPELSVQATPVSPEIVGNPGQFNWVPFLVIGGLTVAVIIYWTYEAKRAREWEGK